MSFSIAYRTRVRKAYLQMLPVSDADIHLAARCMAAMSSLPQDTGALVQMSVELQERGCPLMAEVFLGLIVDDKTARAVSYHIPSLKWTVIRDHVTYAQALDICIADLF